MSSSRPSGLPQFHGNARLFHPDLFYTRCIIEDKPQTFICEQRVEKIQCRCPPVYDANLISNNTNFVFNHSLYYKAHRSKKTFFFIFHKCQALLFYILIDMLLILGKYFSCQGFRGLEVNIFIQVDVSDQHGPSSEHH